MTQLYFKPLENYQYRGFECQKIQLVGSDGHTLCDPSNPETAAYFLIEYVYKIHNDYTMHATIITDGEVYAFSPTLGGGCVMVAPPPRRQIARAIQKYLQETKV